jgi:Holliday junction resolvase RusA-like endonuclease
MTFSLLLPFPVSTNRLWRAYGQRVYASKEYKAWKQEANDYYIQQKRGKQKIEGPFTYMIVLDRTRRKSNLDGDNRLKAPLDFLQSVGLIENDSLAEGGGWAWGDVDGCLIKVEAA